MGICICCIFYVLDLCELNLCVEFIYVMNSRVEFTRWIYLRVDFMRVLFRHRTTIDVKVSPQLPWSAYLNKFCSKSHCLNLVLGIQQIVLSLQVFEEDNTSYPCRNTRDFFRLRICRCSPPLSVLIRFLWIIRNSWNEWKINFPIFICKNI